MSARLMGLYDLGDVHARACAKGYTYTSAVGGHTLSWPGGTLRFTSERAVLRYLAVGAL